MLTENGNIVLSQSPATKTEDYEWLRNTGLGYIQQFSGKLWTDYNLHDPGITMLELLCYALTDLSYRISFPVPDLLTASGKKGPDRHDFFTARKILTSHPVTISDYRKLILDRIPGVRNIWFETLDDTNYTPAIYFDNKASVTKLTQPADYEILQLKGLYIAKLDIEDFKTIEEHHPHFLRTLAHYRDKNSPNTGDLAIESEYGSCLLNYTKSTLLQIRNLCEDFEVIKIADDEWVALCADIELKPDAKADDVFKKIFDMMYNYVNPTIKFHSFKELIDSGKRTEEIFNGPAMKRGFIDDDTLAKHGHREVLYVSDIISLVMDIEGVLQVKKIHLSSYRKKLDGTFEIIEDAQKYCLHLSDKANAVFKFRMDAGEQNKDQIFNHIRFSKGPIYFTPIRKASYADGTFIAYPHLPKHFQNDLPVPEGRNRNLLDYYSVQNDFPLAYYFGMDGIPKTASTLRKAQRLQAKAYLLFFDQVLADYLKMLNGLRRSFTWRGGVDKHTLSPFHLSENLINDLRKLLVSDDINDTDVDEIFLKGTYDKYANVLETRQKSEIRHNKMLDHLMARFNELFVDYTVFKFQQNKEGDFFNESDARQIIQDKINFLKVYPIISGSRSHAFNYVKDIYAADNVSGLQFRLQKMMGITSTKNNPLVKPTNHINYKTLLQNIVNEAAPTSATQIHIYDHRFNAFETTFGMHVLEHILLRPLYKASTAPLSSLLPLCGDGTNNEQADCLLPDYYSHQLTVVLPGWLSISSNMDFRSFTENLIRSEAPAHVALKICWLDPARMYVFEQTANAFFDQMAKIKAFGAAPLAGDIFAFNTALQDVYTMMGILKNYYPSSSLDNCETVSIDIQTGKIDTPVILDYSALGTPDSEEWFLYLEPQPKKPEPVVPVQLAPTESVVNAAQPEVPAKATEEVIKPVSVAKKKSTTASAKSRKAREQAPEPPAEKKPKAPKKN